MHSLDRFLTGLTRAEDLITSDSAGLPVGVVAPWCPADPPALFPVTDADWWWWWWSWLASGPSPSEDCFSSSCDLNELTEEFVTPDEGRSPEGADPPMAVWLLYTDLDSLLRTAFPRAPVLRRLLNRGFRSWTGVVSVLSSGWAQFSVVTVNSMSARASFPAVDGTERGVDAERTKGGGGVVRMHCSR